MADFQNPQYPDLNQMFGNRSMMPAFLGMQQRQQAMGQTQQNVDLGQIMQQHTQQMNPLLEQQQGLVNKQRQAEIPGVAADSTLKINKVLMDQKLMDPEIRAKIAKYASEASDSELKQNENAVKMAVLKGDLSKEQADQMFGLLTEVRKHQMDLSTRKDTSVEVERMRQEGQNRREDLARESGKYDHSWKMGISSKIEMEGDPVKKLTLIMDAAQQAKAKGDTRSYEELSDRATVLENIVKAKLASTQPKPGAVDASALTQGAIPTNPSLPVLPGNSPQRQSQGNELQQAVQASDWAWEPDKYDYRIGPDGHAQRKAKK